MKNKLKILIYLGSLSTSLFFLISCAVSPVLIKNSPEDYKAIKNHNVGVAFFIPDKRVVFTEQIYLVMGYSDQVSFHAYEGIWDPIPVLQEKVFSELNSKYQITPINLNEFMRPEAFSKINELLEEKLIQDFILVKKTGQNNVFLRDKLPVNILNKLKELNIDYFLEVYLASLSFYDFAHYDWIQSGVQTYSRLNRVSDGSIVWLNKSRGGALLKNLNSLAELENNDMALMKKGYQEAVSNCEILIGFAPQ